jgi:nuclear protein NHN1
LATKLNGGRDKEEEPLEEEDEDNSIINSPSSLKDRAPQSICSSSPVSQDALTPPQPPQHTSSLSSSPTGPSKQAIDKQSLSATVSRREELLQQLKAVEDAIARKRSKIN